jgi:hypothetical protein
MHEEVWNSGWCQRTISVGLPTCSKHASGSMWVPITFAWKYLDNPAGGMVGFTADAGDRLGRSTA